MAAPAPHVWDRIKPGFSDWLVQAAQKQREVEKLVEEKNINELRKKHSPTSEADPCKLQQHEHVLSGLNGASVSKLEEIAKTGKVEDSEKARASESSIAACLVDFEALKLPDLVDELENVKDAEKRKMQSASDSLEKIVSTDPAKRKGKDDILLTANYAADAIANMSAEAKDKAHKEIKDKRIAERATIATKGAGNLYANSSWKEKLPVACKIKENIEHQFSCPKALRTRANEALAKKVEVASIPQALEQERSLVQNKLAQCKAEKLNLNKQLSAKKDAFKQALIHIQNLEQEYQDLHIEHEAHRLHIVVLEGQLTENGECLASAQDRIASAMQACDAWNHNNETLANNLDEVITSKAGDVVKRSLPCAQKVADGICLAKQIVWSQKHDEQVRMSGIEKVIEANQQEHDILQRKLLDDEADDDVFTDLATCEDKKKACEVQKDQCSSKLRELEQAEEAAEEQWRVLKGMQVFGNAINEDTTMQKALDMTESFYKKLPLYPKGKQRVSFDPPSRRASEVGSEIVAFNPAQMEMITRMIEEKAQVVAEQKFQQMRADELFRNRDARSECSWTEVGELGTGPQFGGPP